MLSILKVMLQLLHILYSLFKLFPTQKKVVFISRQSDRPSLDMRMLKKEIQTSHPDYQIVLLCKKIGERVPEKIGYCFHMLRQMYHLSTSQIAILDSYAILVSVLHHKKSLLIIQMWHSIGTMKKFGYSILDMPEGSSSRLAKIMKMHANYDYILAASDAYKSHLAEGFHYPTDKIVTLPLPRVEALEDPNLAESTRKKIVSAYPQLTEPGKETILYIPTFRKGEDESFQKAALDLANAVDYSRYHLIIKPHPLSNFTGSHPHAIIDHLFSSFEMLFVSDCVISDYSCIIYEAAILNRPLYFYAYDYDHYQSARDFYIDYPNEMPGPVCTTAEDTLRSISNHACQQEAIRQFVSKYVTPQSNHETRDIVDFIFAHRKS